MNNSNPGDKEYRKKKPQPKDFYISEYLNKIGLNPHPFWPQSAPPPQPEQNPPEENGKKKTEARIEQIPGIHGTTERYTDKFTGNIYDNGLDNIITGGLLDAADNPLAKDFKRLYDSGGGYGAQLSKFTGRELVDAANIQNFFNSVDKNHKTEKTLDFLRGGKGITVKDADGKDVEITNENWRDTISALRKKGVGGDFVWRDILSDTDAPDDEERPPENPDDPDPDDPSPDDPSPDDTAEEAALQYPVEEIRPIKFEMIKDKNGFRALGGYGNVPQAHVAAQIAGLRFIQNQREEAVRLGVLKDKMDSYSHNAALEVEDVLRRSANESPDVQEKNLNEYYQKILINKETSPNAPGIAPQEKMMRYRVLKESYQKAQTILKRQQFEAEKQIAFVDYSNGMQRLSQRLAAGGIDGFDAVTDFMTLYNQQKGFLNQAQRNELVQNGLGQVFAGMAQNRVNQIKQNTAGEVRDIKGALAKLETELFSLYGAALGQIGDIAETGGQRRPDIGILENIGLQVISGAREALQGQNEEFFMSMQAQYETALNSQTPEGIELAANIAARYRPAMSAAGRNEGISAQGVWRGKDWFKPVYRDASAGVSGPALKAAVDAAAKDVRAYYNTGDGTPLKEALNNITGSIVNKYGVEEADIDVDGIRRQLIERVWEDKGVTVDGSVLNTVKFLPVSMFKGAAENMLGKEGGKKEDAGWALQLDRRQRELADIYNNGVYQTLINIPSYLTGKEIPKYITDTLTTFQNDFFTEQTALLSAFSDESNTRRRESVLNPEIKAVREYISALNKQGANNINLDEYLNASASSQEIRRWHESGIVDGLINGLTGRAQGFRGVREKPGGQYNAKEDMNVLYSTGRVIVHDSKENKYYEVKNNGQIYEVKPIPKGASASGESTFDKGIPLREIVTIKSAQRDAVNNYHSILDAGYSSYPGTLKIKDKRQ